MMVDGGQALQGAAGMHVLDGSTCAGGAGSRARPVPGQREQGGETGRPEQRSPGQPTRYIGLSRSLMLGL